MIILLIALVKQNIFENNFPYVVLERERSIDMIKENNVNLANENIILESKIQGYTEEDLNLIESKARFKYGLIKEGEYFFKVKDAVSKVKTPYLVLTDDDDFILPEGLRSCVKFLSDNPDYVSCGGRLATFSLRPNPNATYGEAVEFILHPLANSKDSETALERVEKHFRSYDVTCYDVHRTETLRTVYDEQNTFNPNDILLAEQFVSHLTLTRGKVKRDPNLMLLRQFNILNSACAKDINVKGDSFDRMLLRTWSQDFNGFIDWIIELRKDLKIPHKLSEVLDEKKFDLDKLSQMALDDPSTATNPKKLSKSDMKIMYEHSMSGKLF